MSRIYPTLDPHRLGANLALSQGNLVVTTSAICDFNRAVFGSLGNAIGTVAFEVYFYSQSNPAAGLVDLCSVGVAEVGCDLDKFVGKQALSWGMRTNNGSGNAGIWNNNALVGSALQGIAERQCIGVLLFNDPTTPRVGWHVKGNPIGQANLTAGKVYVPAISIGSAASPSDNAAVINFGQRGGLDYPIMYLNI
jgi:hypothetical protein